MHWLAHFFGTDNLSGPFYGFWSGVGSDITELGLFGALVAHYRGKTCHVDRCWRLGRHPVGEYRVCRKHHPAVPDRITAGHIADVHAHAGPGVR
jgi:hypothetical protein